jgi:hypothetical protein
VLLRRPLGPLRAIARIASLLAIVGACASPTLPLPPPSLPSISASSTLGHYHLTSDRGVEPNALVIVYNRNSSVPLDQRVSGAQADDHGTWDADVVGSPGDYLDVSQELGQTRSAPVTVQIPR